MRRREFLIEALSLRADSVPLLAGETVNADQRIVSQSETKRGFSPPG